MARVIEIIEPISQAHIDAIRVLMRAFVASAQDRYSEEVGFIDRYFDAVAFESELRNLPGKYSRPLGRLLLALYNDRSVGCVALRDLGAGYCEMKRLYVDPQMHGKGIGRSLVVALIEEAKSAGYSAMRLDTGPKQVEAQSLYRSVGFRTIQPYYDMPEELRSWLVFMELDLSGTQNA